MVSPSHRALLSCFLAAGFRLALCEEVSKFAVCKDRLDRILNGTEIYHGISNETIEQYMYRGPVGGMRSEYAAQFRDSFITITTEGCKAICEDPTDPIDWYWTSDTSLTLGIISNWILPIIALLAALPFDTQSGGTTADLTKARFTAARNTAAAVFNWLGSPQTALTATFFNIHQMRKCLDAARLSGDTALDKDAYYVLCCIGQFELPTDDECLNCFLASLAYGLFKPTSGSRFAIVDNHTRQANRWTRDLLHAMAHQMRRSRRLGIWSTLASILLFFVAYAASVVLAFAEVGERTTTHSLAFGILITWLPLLLFFSILDRNPNSADRTRRFIHRWLWNVRAVQAWERDRDAVPSLRNATTQQQHAPYWWTEERELLAIAARRNEDREPGHECTPRSKCELSTFIGQGRHMGYFGLALCVAKAKAGSEKKHTGDGNGWEMQLEEMVDATRGHLDAKPPLAWRLLSVTALALVWWELGMGMTISYNIPTVGVGCRFGSYLVYGALSTIPWFAHVYRYLGPQADRGKEWRRKPGRMVGRLLNGMSRLCMLFSVPCLVFITFAAVSLLLAARGGNFANWRTVQWRLEELHMSWRIESLC